MSEASKTLKIKAHLNGTLIIQNNGDDKIFVGTKNSHDHLIDNGIIVRPGESFRSETRKNKAYFIASNKEVCIRFGIF